MLDTTNLVNDSACSNTLLISTLFPYSLLFQTVRNYYGLATTKMHTSKGDLSVLNNAYTFAIFVYDHLLSGSVLMQYIPVCRKLRWLARSNEQHNTTSYLVHILQQEWIVGNAYSSNQSSTGTTFSQK